MYRPICALLLMTGCVIDYQPKSTLDDNTPGDWLPPETAYQQDRLSQVEVPQVDILWVIDNSGSMSEEQAALSENFEFFLDYFLDSGLDYHIGVVSTDMNRASESGKLQASAGYRFIDPDTVDAIGVFRGMAVLGTGGSSDERGRDAAYAAIAINPNQANDGFYRDDASLHIVAISDEDDHSDAIGRGEFIDWLDTLKRDDGQVSFSSIVSPRPLCNTASQPGDNYNAITQAIGGISWSICDEDGWPTVLEQLGLQASGLKREYFLSQLPAPETLEVQVVENGVTYPFEAEVDWTYNPVRNSVIFTEFIPDALAEVVVNYALLE